MIDYRYINEGKLLKHKNAIEKMAYHRIGSHPNIPKYYDDHNIEINTEAVVIEWINNSITLEGYFPSPELYTIIIPQLIDVVSHIHSKGVTHTDITNPANILYQECNKKIVLIDFEGIIFNEADKSKHEHIMKYDYQCVAYIGWMLLMDPYNTIDENSYELFTDGDPQFSNVIDNMKAYIKLNNGQICEIMIELLEKISG